MSITTIKVLHDLAETSLATYAYFDSNERTDSALAAALQDNNFGASFTPDQTENFVARYKLISTQPNINQNGFSATVFQDKQSGVKVLALRGTEFTQGLGQILVDGLIADGLGIGGTGYANLQSLEMCRYWKRLNTAGGQLVSYTDAELVKLYALKLGPIAGSAVLAVPFLTLFASAGFKFFADELKCDVGIDSGSEGQPVIAPGEKVNVTGHSLGGHLALQFSRIFPDSVSEVVTLNAPTFFTQGDLFLNALGYTNTKSAQVTRVEAEGDGIHVLGNVSFGSVISIAQENQSGAIAAISSNHSSVNGVDAYYLMSILAKLDTSKSDNSAYLSDLVRASANTAIPSYENLADALRKVFAGPNIQALPVGDTSDLAKRATWYATLTALQNNPIVTELAGQLNIRLSSADLRAAARNDFGALIALQDLSPVVISGNNSAADAKLTEIWQVGRAVDYAAWLLDKSAAIPSTYTDIWIQDRAALLQALVIRNQTDETSGTIRTNIAPVDRDLQFQWYGAEPLPGEILPRLATLIERKPYYADRPEQKVAFGDDNANALMGTENRLGDHLYGGGGNDMFDGKAGADYVQGDAGNDSLDGGAGDRASDTLVGGIGTDTYQFTGAFGKDLILDSDGLGQIKIDDYSLTNAKAVPQRNVWIAELASGEKIGLSVYDDSRSSTGKKLVITRGGSVENTITIDSFDLARAQAAGYLGIRLEPTVKIVVKEGAGTNPFADINFDASALNGSAELAEGSGSVYTVFLSKSAKQGDTVTLALSGASDKFKVRQSGELIDAGGAVFILSEGQTELKILLLQQGEVTADAIARLSVNYEGSSSGQSQSVTSNNWGINLKDSGEVAHTFTGDQHGAIVTNPESGHQSYNWASTQWAGDGTLAGGVIDTNFSDVIYADNGNSKISGLGGNDALDGADGNDSIDGGDGDDLIAGGAGDDSIKGGDGNDVIRSSAYLTAAGRSGPDDEWQAPVGAVIEIDNATWGSYRLGGVVYYSGISSIPNTEENDVIDGGAGNDLITASWGDDFVQGGSGDDTMYGMAGDDMLEGGAGNDLLTGDGLTKPGYLVSVPATAHGEDFIDGGEGNDTIYGGGKGDQLFGGSGDDIIFGDGSARADLELYVSLDYHGDDYLDGEDGDDYLEGGGKNDVLFGGSGKDVLIGDTGVENLQGQSPNSLQWGNDYLDGEDDADYLEGGGKDDTLYGGTGNDMLLGDTLANVSVTEQMVGNDYLDGEDGSDYLEGGGKDDTIFGGDGSDVLVGDSQNSALNADLHGNDYLDGEAGSDQLVGGGKNDTLYGGLGDDYIWGDNSEHDQLAAEMHGNDYLSGDEGNDLLVGGGKDDTLFGGAGNDDLFWGRYNG